MTSRPRAFDGFAYDDDAFDCDFYDEVPTDQEVWTVKPPPTLSFPVTETF